MRSSMPNEMGGIRLIIVILCCSILLVAGTTVIGQHFVVRNGDLTVLHCAANDSVIFNHFNTDAHSYNSGDKEVNDCDGNVSPHFQHRYQFSQNNKTGTAELRVNSTKMEDAGQYICRLLDGTEIASVNLSVIDADPKCESSVPLQEVVGPNDCGIPSDEIRLTCSVTYKGPNGSQPILEWRRVGDNQTLNQTCDIVGDRLSCNETINATLDLNGTAYICTTTQSATTQYSCTTDTINVSYAFNTNSEKHIDMRMEEKQACVANSSQNCTYEWKRFRDNGDSWTVSNDRIFSPKDLNTFPCLSPKESASVRCEATCTIRNTPCTIISRIVHILNQSAQVLPNPAPLPLTGQSNQSLPNSTALPLTGQSNALRSSSVALLIGLSYLCFYLLT